MPDTFWLCPSVVFNFCPCDFSVEWPVIFFAFRIGWNARDPNLKHSELTCQHADQITLTHPPQKKIQQDPAIELFFEELPASSSCCFLWTTHLGGVACLAPKCLVTPEEVWMGWPFSRSTAAFAASSFRYRKITEPVTGVACFSPLVPARPPKWDS